MGDVAGMRQDVLTAAEVKRRLPTITAKAELVLLDDAMYKRESDGYWYLLDGSAAPEPSGAAPLSGEGGPSKSPARGDDDSAERGTTPSVPQPEASQPK